MVTQFEEKGKIYTPVISKDPVRVIIQTTMNRVEGEIHLRPETRLIDELEKSANFLAITSASVFTADGSLAYTTRFLTINRSHIIWILPTLELVAPEDNG